jgi:hypothetical protein
MSPEKEDTNAQTNDARPGIQTLERLHAELGGEMMHVEAVIKMLAPAHKAPGSFGIVDPLQVFASPTVSATLARRVPSGLPPPSVLSTAV